MEVLKGGEPVREVFPERGGPMWRTFVVLLDSGTTAKPVKMILLSFILTWNLTGNDV